MVKISLESHRDVNIHPLSDINNKGYNQYEQF